MTTTRPQASDNLGQLQMGGTCKTCGNPVGGCNCHVPQASDRYEARMTDSRLDDVMAAVGALEELCAEGNWREGTSRTWQRQQVRNAAILYRRAGVGPCYRLKPWGGSTKDCAWGIDEHGMCPSCRELASLDALLAAQELTP